MAAYIFVEQADNLGIPTPIDHSIIDYHRQLVIAALGDKKSAVTQLAAQKFPHPSVLPMLALAQQIMGYQRDFWIGRSRHLLQHFLQLGRHSR